MTTTPPRKWTEQAMKRALYAHFTAAGYAVLTEVSTAEGVQGNTLRSHRRIDVLAIRPARRLGIGPVELLAIEVKVTRADFLSDVRHPEKQAPWRELAHRHAYAVPAGLVCDDEVPTGHGLLTVDAEEPGWDKVAWARQVRFEERAPRIPARLFVAIAYRLATLEAAHKGLNPLIARTHITEEPHLP